MTDALPFEGRATNQPRWFAGKRCWLPCFAMLAGLLTLPPSEASAQPSPTPDKPQLTQPSDAARSKNPSTPSSRRSKLPSHPPTATTADPSATLPENPDSDVSLEDNILNSTQDTSPPEPASLDTVEHSTMLDTSQTGTPPLIAPETDSLEYYLQLAIENHPALDVASNAIAAMQQDAHQAGLCPNPQLGLFADEVGNEDSAGLVGAFLQRKIVRGNKRQLARIAKCLESEVLAQQYLQQRQRVETDVRTEFYMLLVAQRRVELTRQLRQIQQQAVTTATQLNEADESPKTDVLQTEVQAGLTNIKWQQAQVRQQAAWRRLMTAASFPELPLQKVNGSLNEITHELVFEHVLSSILSESPERQAAVAKVNQTLGQLKLELANAIPDYQTQITIGQDTSTDDFFTGFQFQVPLMINDRNQGAIAAARHRVAQARHQIAQVELRISQRLANDFETYDSAAIQVRVFDDQLLPKSRQTLELVSEGYREGEVGFLQVLAAQQSLLDLTLEYLGSLEKLWTARQRIEGLTLSNNLNF